MRFSKEAVRRIMQKEGINQSQLSAMLGMSRATVSRALSGKYQPSVKFLSALKRAFPEINLEYFFKDTVA